MQPLAYGSKCYWNGTEAQVVSASDRKCALYSTSPTPTTTPSPSVTPSTGSSASPSPEAVAPSASPTPLFSVAHSCAGRNDGMYCARSETEDPDTDSQCTKGFFYCAHGTPQDIQDTANGTSCFFGALIFDDDARCDIPLSGPSPSPTPGLPRTPGDCDGLEDGLHCGPATSTSCASTYFFCSHGISSGLLDLAAGTQCYIPTTTVVDAADLRCNSTPNNVNDTCYGQTDGAVVCLAILSTYENQTCKDGFAQCLNNGTTLKRQVAPGTLCYEGGLVYDTDLDCVDVEELGTPGYLRTGITLLGGNASNFINDPSLGRDFRQDIAASVGLVSASTLYARRFPHA